MTKNNDTYWAKEFEKTLSKEAVKSKKQESLFDQINSIMNGKSKFQTVEAKVDDMKRRSGLTEYLQKKKASAEVEPQIFKEFASIRNTIENFIRDSGGHLPIPAILQKVKSIHKSDVTDEKLWDDSLLLKFISDLNTQYKSVNPNSHQDHHNLGKTNYDIDDLENEVFSWMK